MTVIDNEELAALRRIADIANNLALEALAQYNADIKTSEPVYPQWAFNIAVQYKKVSK